MIKITVIAALIAAAGYYFPQIYEQTGSPCQAVERKIIRENTDRATAESRFSGLTLSLSKGAIGQKMAHDAFPRVPNSVACIVAYYDFPEEWKR